MSGFFLDREYFITCAHFGLEGNAESEMKVPGSRLAWASCRREPFGMCYRLDQRGIAQIINCVVGPGYRKLYLYLLHLDMGRDIAIFKLDSDQNTGFGSGDSYKGCMGSITFDQLIASKDSQHCFSLAGRRVFSVGYNSTASREKFEGHRQRVKELLTPEKRLKAEKGPENVGTSLLL